MKAYISMPSVNFSNKIEPKEGRAIVKKRTDEREEAITYLKGKGYTIEDNWPASFSNPDSLRNVKNMGIYYLAQTLSLIAQCDTVYFGTGWVSDRRCLIEHEVAKKYGLHIIYGEEMIIEKTTLDHTLEFADNPVLASAT